MGDVLALQSLFVAKVTRLEVIVVLAVGLWLIQKYLRSDHHGR